MEYCCLPSVHTGQKHKNKDERRVLSNIDSSSMMNLLVSMILWYVVST